MAASALRPPNPARRKAAAAEPPPSAAAVQTWLSVVRSYHLCDAVMTRRLAALGLKLTEHEVLVNLLRAPGLTQQALAARCFVAKSGISMLVSRMADAGWLERRADAGDARLWRLWLTDAGQALAARALAMQQAVVTAMTAGSTDAELKAFESAMLRAHAALEAMLQDDGR